MPDTVVLDGTERSYSNVGMAEAVSTLAVESDAAATTPVDVQTDEFSINYHNLGPHLSEEDYPALAAVWDNASDDIFDKL